MICSVVCRVFFIDGSSGFPGKTSHSQWTNSRGATSGFSYGATDEHGYEAVENRLHIHDWHATILHLLGLDHEKLTYRHAGRDFRLTDVKGQVTKEILA